MEEINHLMERAIGEIYRGDFSQAENTCHLALKINANHAEALHILGLACGQQGRLSEAVDYIKKSIINAPGNYLYYNNLGEMYKRQGKLQEAAENFQRSMNLNPDVNSKILIQANKFRDAGNLSEAIKLYRQAIAQNPEDFQAIYNLGNVLMEQREYQGAIESYQNALRIIPDIYDAHYNLGLALQELNRLDEAIYHLQQAIKLNPNIPNAYYSLAICYQMQNKTEEASQTYHDLLKYEPDNICLKLHIDKISPDIYFSNAEIDNYREKLLKTIDKYISLDIKIDLRKTYENISLYPTLFYQGREDRYINEKYAEIFKNKFQAGTGRSVKVAAPKMRPVPANKKPHIGFVVTNSHEGMFSKCMKGIINNLSGEEFNLTIFCDPLNGFKMLKNKITNPAVRLIGLPKHIEGMVEIIKKENCDIFYYWEVGTDTANYFLPFFKLAPIQCTSWGWPVTTGIPQMDYFISSELLETEESDNYYTEKLIRFKHLPVYYYRPLIPKDLKPRSYFGFSETDHLYFCMQNLRKVHPDFDNTLLQILQKDQAGIILFKKDKQEYINFLLRKRIEKNCPEVLSRIKFIEMSFEEYLNVISISNVIIDPYHLSGANTTFEAFSAGTPVVTLPSKLQRGRYTYAAYCQMNIFDCIAKNEEDYVNIVLKIGNEPQYREQLRKRILENCSVLFEDMNAVKELESFFKSVVKKRRDESRLYQ